MVERRTPVRDIGRHLQIRMGQQEAPRTKAGGKMMAQGRRRPPPRPRPGSRRRALLQGLAPLGPERPQVSVAHSGPVPSVRGSWSTSRLLQALRQGAPRCRDHVSGADPGAGAMAEPKKLFIKTYGCQMNVYDSERMAKTLGAEGYVTTDRRGRRRHGPAATPAISAKRRRKRSIPILAACGR